MRRENIVMKMNIEGRIGRLKERWLGTSKNNIRAAGVWVGDATNLDKREK